MKKLENLSLEQVQVELERRGLTVAGKDEELGQLLTDLSRQVFFELFLFELFL